MRHVRCIDNILLLGDMNADCDYLSQAEADTLRLRTDPDFHWLIADDVDTSARSSDCAFDR